MQQGWTTHRIISLRWSILLALLLFLSCIDAWALPQTGRQQRQRRRILTKKNQSLLIVVQHHPSSKSLLRMTTTTTGGDGDSRRTEPVAPKRNNSFAWKHSLSVVCILASAFLNLLGFTMAGPITPALGQHFQLQVGAKFGSLTSAYPLGMLAGLFLWPQLSDRIGRKPVMTLSFVGSGIGLAAQSYAISQHWPLSAFLWTRVLTGSFAGSSPVSKAFLADVGAREGKLPRYLALRDAACTMAFLIGPLAGGLLFDFYTHRLGDITTTTLQKSAAATGNAILHTTGSLAFVIGITSVASLAAAALTALLVQEVPPTKKKQKDTLQQQQDEEVVACPLGLKLWAGVATVCIISFLFNVGDSTFHAFFPSLLRERLSLDTRSIGLFYTVFASVSFLVSATVAGKTVQFFGPVTTCAFALFQISMGLLILAVAQTTLGHVWSAAALYYCGVPLYGPTIPTMLLRCVPSHQRGAVMGLDGAINTIGRVIAPLITGELYRLKGPSAAFGLASSSVLIAAVLTLLRRGMVIRNRKNGGDNVIVMKKED